MSLSSAADTHAVSAPSLYRAVWRWHFYAGLLTLPFLVLLAVTGGLYLFNDELDALLFRDRLYVEAQSTPALPPSVLLGNVLTAYPDSVTTSYTSPADANRSAQIDVTTSGGQDLLVYANPYTGTVLNSVEKQDRLMQVVRKLHSLEYLGPYANILIEIVAGWTIILVVTGFYLWWPRQQDGGVMTVRGTPERRVFWRDLHAVSGAGAGLLIAFLALSGLPWSKYWGNWVNQGANAIGQGYPELLWDATPVSSLPMEDLGHVAWTLEHAPIPVSTHQHEKASISVDQASAIVESMGIAPGYELSLPQEPTGVYTAMVFPDDLSQQRAIHLDRYNGQVLADLRFQDYGTVAKAVEWGINVHMGQEFGRTNQLLMLATCLLLILMSLSAITMWWKRRPPGRLAAPPAPRDYRSLRVVALLLLPLAVLFPLTGASLIAVLVLEKLGSCLISGLQKQSVLS